MTWSVEAFVALRIGGVMSRWRLGEVDGADEEGGHLRSGYGLLGQ